MAASPTQASYCTTRGEALKQLSAQYDEQPIAIGIANNGGVLEVLSSKLTWTIIITMPNGRTCLIAAGENWENLPVKKGEES